MVLIRCFLPICLIPISVAVSSNEALERFQEHLKLFRGVLGAKNETHLALLRQALSSTPTQDRVVPSITNDVDQIFSILPVGELPPVSRTETATVTVTSVTTPEPIEPSLLEDIFRSLLQKHMESLPTEANPTPTSASSEQQSSVETESVRLGSGHGLDIPAFETATSAWAAESDTLLEQVIGEPNMPTTHAVESILTETRDSTILQELPRSGRKKQLINQKSSNKIEILPQFRHHDKAPVVVGRTYGKPKTAWYGDYARTHTQLSPLVVVSDLVITAEAEANSIESSSVTEVSVLIPLMVEIDDWGSISGESHTEMESAKLFDQAELTDTPERSTAPKTGRYPTPTTQIDQEVQSHGATTEAVPSGRRPPTRGMATDLKAHLRRKGTNQISYATAAPRTPEYIQSTRDRRKKTRAANIYDVFSNMASHLPTYSLTTAILVFAFVFVFL